MVDWTPAELKSLRGDVGNHGPRIERGLRLPSARLFDWAKLGSVLESESCRDVLVVDRGEISPLPTPRSEACARQVLAVGHSVVVRGAQHHDPPIARLVAAFHEAFGGAVGAQLFATPPQQRSFAWHYDAEDVFVLQTTGTKDYWLRRNTLAPRPAMHDQPDFRVIDRETSETVRYRLTAGDWLYIPSPWWHVAQSVDEAFSISIGLFP